MEFIGTLIFLSFVWKPVYYVYKAFRTGDKAKWFDEIKSYGYDYWNLVTPNEK